MRAPVARLGASLTLLLLTAAPAFASEAEGGPVNLLEPKAGLMFWTLVIFAGLLFILSRYAFKPLFAAVEAREQALEAAIAGAQADRAAAADALAQVKAQLESARTEAQAIVADSRATAEKVRNDLLAQAKQQQEEMIESARRVIDGERAAAVAALRREAVDLAIAGASRVIGQNLDAEGNRRIVESFLASLDGAAGAR
ncbi:MAG: F0F1 ATP synthase subunit B [Gemmatimonadetes bacterium]|nr:F0F1 ATP synthase subunit B [Gemmatimonadota bacterium]